MHHPLSLKNQFLIAMPQLADPHFAHTVTYVVDHTSESAMGFIINRPSQLTMGDLLKQHNIEPYPICDINKPIYAGGPLHRDRGFVLHSNDRTNWAATVKITPEYSVTTSRDILEAIAMGIGPGQYFLALGHVGWTAGQLEQEIANNTWLTTPTDEDIIFTVRPELRWQAAALQMGVDLHLISHHVGHA